MSTQNKQLVTFLDNIGRTIIGKVVSEDESKLSIENPALVHIQPNSQTNQLQLQILPLFFREFQADKSQPTVWHFNKSNITMSSDIVFAIQFSAQYDQLFQVAASQQDKKPEVIRLFDEE